MDIKQLHKYVGIPYLSNGRTIFGCDCWGLVYIVFKNELGIDLPIVSGEYIKGTEAGEVAPVFERYKKEMVAEKKFTEVNEFSPCDLILFRLSGAVSHIGIFACEEKFLHTDGRAGACFEKVNHRYWNRRIDGIYRHESKM